MSITDLLFTHLLSTYYLISICIYFSHLPTYYLSIHLWNFAYASPIPCVQCRYRLMHIVQACLISIQIHCYKHRLLYSNTKGWITYSKPFYFPNNFSFSFKCLGYAIQAIHFTLFFCEMKGHFTKEHNTPFPIKSTFLNEPLCFALWIIYAVLWELGSPILDFICCLASTSLEAQTSEMRQLSYWKPWAGHKP